MMVKLSNIMHSMHNAKTDIVYTSSELNPAQFQAEFLNTSTTLSPLKNIFEMNLSLLIGLPFFPLANLGVSVHIYC
jgi:hypothetical protein